MLNIQRVKNLPIGVVATGLGTSTLGNAFNLFGLTTVRHILMGVGIFIWILGLSKMILYFSQYKEDYKSALIAGLYGSFSMLGMNIGSYIYPVFPAGGTALLWAALILHIFFILFFTYYHAFRYFNKDLFLPSWFVTYFGILVAPIVGKGMLPDIVLQCVVYYSVIPFAFVFLPLVWKGLRRGISANVVHTKTIFLAPPSLCLAAYLGFFPQGNLYLVCFLYFCILCGLLCVLIHLRRFFSVQFTPAFAALTFPMAIAIIAGFRAGKYFAAQGYQTISLIVSHITEANLLLTTIFIYYILVNWFHLWAPNALQRN